MAAVPPTPRPQAAPASLDGMEQTRRPLDRAVATMCSIAGFYGIAFGALSAPSLLLNLNALIVATPHILFGISYWIAANGIRQHKEWAPLLAASCAVSTAILGSAAVAQGGLDAGGTVWWTTYAIYFACLAVLSIRLCFHRQFSLRALLAITTIVAAMLGVIAFMLRL